MSLSDFSELTSLSSDEEDYAPQSKKKKSAAAGKRKQDYNVKKPLRPPRTAQYTAESLYNQMHEGNIDLDPEYQREVVWPESKQIGLIDSILRNYYLPPVIFAVIYGKHGEESRTCIDGKQRLTSISRFMDGLIPHKDSETNKKYFYKSTSAKQTLLPKPLRQSFSQKQIVCIEYDGLTGDEEREIFQRVQLGVALTPAERMQAITGPWSGLIRDIQSRILGEDGFGSHLEWGHSRGRDFQCLATIINMIENFPTFKCPAAPQLEKWLQQPGSPSSKFQASVMDTFRVFVVLVRDKAYNGPFSKPTRVSPVEFVMIGVLIFAHMKKLSLQQLCSAIKDMRTDVRGKFRDIRSNTKVTKCMFDFITKKLDVGQLKGDGNGDLPAIGQAREIAPMLKRKRKEEANDSDSDSEVPLAKVRSTPTKPTKTPKSQASSSKLSSSTSESKSSSKSSSKLQSAKPSKFSPPSAVAAAAGSSSSHSLSQPVSQPQPLPLISAAGPSSSSQHTPLRQNISPPIQPKLEPQTFTIPPSTHPDRLAAIRAARAAVGPPSTSTSTAVPPAGPRAMFSTQIEPTRDPRLGSVPQSPVLPNGTYPQTQGQGQGPPPPSEGMKPTIDNESLEKLLVAVRSVPQAQGSFNNGNAVQQHTPQMQMQTPNGYSFSGMINNTASAWPGQGMPYSNGVAYANGSAMFGSPQMVNGNGPGGSPPTQHVNGFSAQMSSQMNSQGGSFSQSSAPSSALSQPPMYGTEKVHNNGFLPPSPTSQRSSDYPPDQLSPNFRRRKFSDDDVRWNRDRDWDRQRDQGSSRDRPYGQNRGDERERDRGWGGMSRRHSGDRA